MRKALKILLATTTALMWSSTYANAMPFTIGSAVLSLGLAIPGGTAALSLFGAASAASIGGSVISFAITAAQVAFSIFAKPNTPRPEAVKSTVQGSSGPGRHCFGTVLSAAKIAYGRTTNRIVYKLGLQYFGERDGIEEVFINGVPSIVEDDGVCSSRPWTKDPSPGSYLDIQFKPGDGTETVWTELNAAYPKEWTTNHKVQGIAQFQGIAYSPGVGSGQFAKRFQNRFPEIITKDRALKVYDPRDTLTRWTTNAALIALHYFRIVSGYPDTEIDFDKMGDAADWCDVVVDTKDGGSAKQSQLSGSWEGLLDIDKVLTMLECAGLQLRQGDDGKVYFEPLYDNPTAELTFPWEHVLDWTHQNGPDGALRPNLAKVKYYSPESRYTVEEIPDMRDIGWAIVPADITKNGEREKEINLPFCPDCSQAQRIARYIFWMSRARTMVVKTSLAGRALRRLHCINLEVKLGTEDDGSDYVVTLKGIIEFGSLEVNNSDGTCTFTFRVIPDTLLTDFDPDTDEADPPPYVPPGNYESEVTTPDEPFAATTVQYPISGDYETRCVFQGVEYGETAEIFYNTYNSEGNRDRSLNLEEYLTEDSTFWSDSLDATTAIWLGWEVDLNLIGEKASFRARVFNADLEPSQLSDELTEDPIVTDNTAPSAPTITPTWDSGSWLVDYTSSVELSVVAIRFETALSPGGPWTLQTKLDYRPGEAKTGQSVTAEAGTVPYTTYIRARLETTDGTIGAASSTGSHTESV